MCKFCIKKHMNNIIWTVVTCAGQNGCRSWCHVLEKKCNKKVNAVYEMRKKNNKVNEMG